MAPAEVVGRGRATAEALLTLFDVDVIAMVGMALCVDAVAKRRARVPLCEPDANLLQDRTAT